MPAVIMILVGLAYANTFSVPFIFDDAVNVVGNRSIRDLKAVGQVLSPPADGGFRGRPALNVSFALSYAIGGPTVTAHHGVNLLIHVGAALTLFGLVRRTLALPAGGSRRGSTADAIALLIALLWGLHPLQTEAVTYLSQRAEALMGLFYLQTLYCFVRSAGAEGRSKLGWGALAVALCFLGMATKEVMVTAPVIILLYDVIFLAGSWRGAWRQRGALHLMLMSSWLLLARLMHGISKVDVGYDEGVSGWTNAMTECRVVLDYLRLSFWPHPLIFYRQPVFIRHPGEIVLPALVLLAILGSSLALLLRKPPIGFAVAWIFLVLAPTSTIVPIVKQPFAEHRMYLPLAGLAVLFVITLFALGGRRAFYFGVPLALVLGGATWRRNWDYRTELAIWTDTVAKEPTSSSALNNLGLADLNLGRFQDAIGPCQAAIRIDPDNELAHNNLGAALAGVGQPREAIAEFAAAMRIRPTFSDAINNLGGALLLMKRNEEALPYCRRAIELRPDFAQAHCNLGTALDPNHLKDSLREYAEAARLDPTRADFRTFMAQELGKLGRWQEAIAQSTIAVRLDPHSAAARFGLGWDFDGAGREADALREYEAALLLDPDYTPAHNNLAGHLLKFPSRSAEAVAHLRAVVRVLPDSADSHRNLGFALAASGHWDEAIAEERAALRIDPNYQLARDELAAALAHEDQAKSPR